MPPNVTVLTNVDGRQFTTLCNQRFQGVPMAGPDAQRWHRGEDAVTAPKKPRLCPA